MSFPLAICYAGYPGAGKSEAARIGAGLIGGEVVSMGDYIRRFYQEDVGDDADSHSLGEYATEFRDRNGPEGLADRMCRGWAEDSFPDNPVHIDGLRCEAGHDVFEWFFEAVPILWVRADFHIRLKRLNDRGREGEDQFSADDLLTRDGREEEWGTLDLRYMDETTPIENNTDRETLERNLAWELMELHEATR